MASLFPSLVALVLGLVAVWAARDGWKRWLQHLDVRQQVEVSIASHQRETERAVTAMRDDMDARLKLLKAAQQGMLDDMVSAKAEIDQLKHTLAATHMSGGRRGFTGLGPRG